MMSETAVVIDTECTGLKEPEPLEICITRPFEFFKPELPDDGCCHYFSERKPIEFGAMATHHIFPGMHSAHPQWPRGWMFPDDVGYMIGHNVDYDWEAIGKPNVKRICTLSMSRKEWPDLDSHRQDGLQYYFASLTPGEKPRFEAYCTCQSRLMDGAHSAFGDVISCINVLRNILNGHPDITSWQQLWEKSEKDRVPEFLTFGKYGPQSDWAKQNNMPKGMPVYQVKAYDFGYWRWLVGGQCDQVNRDPYLERALRGTML